MLTEENIQSIADSENNIPAAICGMLDEKIKSYLIEIESLRTDISNWAYTFFSVKVSQAFSAIYLINTSELQQYSPMQAID